MRYVITLEEAVPTSTGVKQWIEVKGFETRVYSNYGDAIVYCEKNRYQLEDTDRFVISLIDDYVIKVIKRVYLEEENRNDR